MNLNISMSNVFLTRIRVSLESVKKPLNFLILVVLVEVFAAVVALTGVYVYTRH
jgi:hypothetical protein